MSSLRPRSAAWRVHPRNRPLLRLGDFRNADRDVESRRSSLVMPVPHPYDFHHHVPNVIGFSSPKVIFVGTRPRSAAALVCGIQCASSLWVGLDWDTFGCAVKPRSLRSANPVQCPPAPASRNGWRDSTGKHKETRMTTPRHLPIPSRDTLDRLNELSERLVALSMVGANQRPTPIPEQFNEAYFDQMSDLSSEVYSLCHRLDEDLSYLAPNSSLVS